MIIIIIANGCASAVERQNLRRLAFMYPLKEHLRDCGQYGLSVTISEGECRCVCACVLSKRHSYEDIRRPTFMQKKQEILWFAKA